MQGHRKWSGIFSTNIAKEAIFIYLQKTSLVWPPDQINLEHTINYKSRMVYIKHLRLPNQSKFASYTTVMGLTKSM